MSALPECTRLYQNHHLDSSRWHAFRPRGDDIVIATSYKAGTTWTQAIVANLLFADQDFPAPPWQMSPWLDMRAAPLDDLIAMLEAQRHRRFIKTHLALDGLLYYPQVKYIFVARDGRDVFMSLWNHYSNYTDETYGLFNDTPGRVGPKLPYAPTDIHEFWAQWCARGWFEWESDGWPFWSHLGVAQSWWTHRRLANILFLHYADMKRDTAGAIRRIARFLDIDLAPDRLARVADLVAFDNMKKHGRDYVPSAGASWKGGVDTFLHKGANGRWRDVLSAAELTLYDEACARSLSEDCRLWLESGESDLLA